MSSSQKDFIYNSLQEGLRLDGRGLIDHRKIEFLFGEETGQVEFRLGDTVFFTKVFAELTEPKPERPSEGFIKFKIDLNILQEDMISQDVKNLQIELQKLLEKVIKESKYFIKIRVIDTKSFNLITSKQCWAISIESTLINNDGNIIDACYFSIIIALMHFKKPRVVIQQNRIEVLNNDKSKFQPLSINHIPLFFTFGLYKNTILVDSNLQESLYEDGRITIAMNQYYDLCLIHKPGGIAVEPAIINQIIEVCKIKVKQFINDIRGMLKQRDQSLLIRLNHLLSDKMEIEA